MNMIKNHLATVKIAVNSFFAVVSGYFLIASGVFLANPWYLVIIYSLISAAFLLGIWLAVRLIYRKAYKAIKNSPQAIKKIPGALKSKHQIKTPARKGRK